MTCDGCVKDISGSLNKIEGINKVDANLKEQLVFIEGTAPPSKIVSAIQDTGRDAILRGSGTSNSTIPCSLFFFEPILRFELHKQVPPSAFSKHTRIASRIRSADSRAWSRSPPT